MLSYQHIYHAGCIADVHKHSILSVIFSHLILKGKALSYFETHAGRGLYDLESQEAQKTKEADMGIERVLKDNVFPKEHPYLQIVEKSRLLYGNRIYPGSPIFAEYLLGNEDQIHLMELHPQEVNFLRKTPHKSNVHIHFRNGFEGVLGLAPPTPRRGFVFIDPSYEIKNEYGVVLEFVKKLHRKWPEGIVAVWYPKLKAGHHESMVEEILELDLKNIIVSELEFADKKTCKGMYGSGMLIVNCPFGVNDAISDCKDRLEVYYKN